MPRGPGAIVSSWKTCGGSCGQCSVGSTSKFLKTMRPEAMLEWAHNVIDAAEELMFDTKGVAKNYRFKCNKQAEPNTFICPRDDDNYIKSRQHNIDLITSAVDTIVTSLTVYNNDRVVLSAEIGERLNGFVQSDIDDFKQSMKSQFWFSVVHAAIDEINITSHANGTSASYRPSTHT